MIATRAYYLGLMSDTQYRYFWASVNKKGYKYKEPLDEELELSQPVKMNSLIKLYFDKDILTPTVFINDLNVEPQFLNEIAGLNLSLFTQNSEYEKRKSVLNLFG
ncbi:hypothetical protein [Staphylococcus warneri]|uniref:hypothetical protein n=1 Tax=Staphylococcus warneri TaxID=1292 RepID=UPI003F6DDE8E